MVRFWLVLVSTVFLFSEDTHTNALIHETSPYLQQHAHNPVNWYPWGKEALERAKKEHKLIFLSIGYSTCHWCHEMEKESFTDMEVAKLLNEHYISIKVDREEYPQLDRKYQKLFMAKYGKRGGWPLTVFLSPKGEVFHIATYIPKEEGYGSPGLMKMLPSFVALQTDRRSFARAIADFKILEKKRDQITALKEKALKEVMDKVIQELSKQFDNVYGGFAFRPKFPEASKIALLLTIDRLTDSPFARKMALETLTKMARSGLYDQVEGGFFRYTTDEAWQQPHFEKMLYTNAELIGVYAEAYLLTDDPLYLRVAEESVAWVERYFSWEGLLFAASDADSDAEEGGYYIYDYFKIREALQKKGWKVEVIDANLAYFGIEEDGNVDGELSHAHLTSVQKPPRVEAFKNYLRSLRTHRVFPFIDKKVITAWNAMMIKALFVAGRIDAKYTTMAQTHLQALLKHMYRNGVLYHQTLFGKKAEQKAILEDYAFLIDALLEGYERTYKVSYLQLSDKLARDAVRKFYRKGRWYLSDDGTHAEADYDDRYYTSALSVMLEDLLTLAVLQEDRTYLKYADETIRLTGGILYTHPAEVAKLVQTYMRLKKGDVVIHAIKERLLAATTMLSEVKYPFLLSKAQENEGYLACGIGQCFTEGENLAIVLAKIEEIKSNKGVSSWQK